ncbi:P-loop containing nucleoside triphosphate hydrolase protein [Sporodiniella umbellata]|nr:P-loop containing nucleoside triphosphate hydrolase protein [Sporodiniella umbellata]
MGLQEGQKVNVEFCRNVPDCTTVNVEPLTEDDWEILELHAGYVEDNLLGQVRAVYNNQIMCVWIHGKTLVKLAVGGIDPSHEYAKLSNNSEVIVAPKVRQKAPVNEENTLNSVINKSKSYFTARVAPATEVNELFVYAHPRSILSLGEDVPSVVCVSKLIPSFASLPNRKEEEQNDPEEISNMKALFAKLIVTNDVPLKHVWIGSTLKSSLEVKDFDIVKISCTGIKKSPLGALVLRRLVSPTSSTSVIKLGLESSQQQAQQKAQFEEDCTSSIHEWLSKQESDYVVSQKLHINLHVNGTTEQFIVQLGTEKGLFSSATTLPDGDAFFVVPSNQKLSISFGEDIVKAPTINKSHDEENIVLGGVSKLLKRIEDYALANLAEKKLKASLSVPRSGGILLTGAHGSGKTSVVKQVMKSARQSLIYTIQVDCSEISDERIPVLKDLFQKYLDEAIWHGPSLLFFDNLDRLIPAEVEHADSTRSRHLAEIFTRLVVRMCTRYPIMIIATAQQQQSIHTALITHHVFSELNHLQPPSRDERKLIVDAIISQGPDVLRNSMPDIDTVSIASETEGFLAADMKAFIERSIHEGAIRTIKNKMRSPGKHGNTLKLIQADFIKAREGFVPSSLRGIKLQSSGVNWSDIGGLNETRKALLETLEWPTKYAAVFSQCPLRLRSGVKGPEILNKYIGASEKSVRDLFDRAQAAKPCILFFDEFDSIAPRRGHDSTGVTDRVVNQMLTQMDGAEGLDGVYVLAATSRPDLIDPALLRPGRLDKALLCGMPDVQERLEILEALSSKMKLAADVNLEDFAEKTEGYSGADLQGFLYNAHLEAIHGSIDIESFKEAQTKPSEKGGQNEFVMSGVNKIQLTSAERGQISQRLAMIKKEVLKDQPAEEKQHAIKQAEAEITTDYLIKSIDSTRPSITIEEYYRLKMIYDEFVTGRTGELPSGEGAKGVGKRSTLG